MKRSRLKRYTPLKSYKRLQSRKPMNKIGKVTKERRRRQAKVLPTLKARSRGLCEHCGRSPDWRGLHPHHVTFRSRGGIETEENEELWCAPCHFGPDGHRTEGRIKGKYKED